MVSPTDPYDLNSVSIMNSRLPPLSEDFSGNYFLLGTDGAGRDMVSAIFYGLRVSLGVGVLSGIFALIIGSFFGIGSFSEWLYILVQEHNIKHEIKTKNLNFNLSSVCISFKVFNIKYKD